jgi:hypothetical protein
VNFLSFLLNGDQMRKRLAQMLEQATEQEQKIEQHDQNNQSSISRSGTVE